MRAFVALLFLCFASTRASAVDFVASIGLGDGGRNLSEISGHQNYDINAGGVFFAAAGFVFPLTPTTPHRFEIQPSLIYLVAGDSRPGDDNRVNWERYGLEVLYYYRNTQENIRLGWGPVYQVANRLTGQGLNASVTEKFDDSWGWTIAAEKLFHNQDSNSLVGFGLKCNFISYHSSTYHADANGNAIFATASFLTD